MAVHVATSQNDILFLLSIKFECLVGYLCLDTNKIDDPCPLRVYGLADFFLLFPVENNIY